MKSLFALAAVVAALALAAPAGAMPIIDPPQHTATPPATAPARPAPEPSDGTSLLVVVIIGAAAFLTGAGAARLVRLPRRGAAAG